MQIPRSPLSPVISQEKGLSGVRAGSTSRKACSHALYHSLVQRQPTEAKAVNVQVSHMMELHVAQSSHSDQRQAPPGPYFDSLTLSMARP